MTFKLLKIFRLLKEIGKALKRIKNQFLFLTICEEQNLAQEDTDIMAAIIMAESRWNDKAIGYNRNGTVDYGLVQWNNYWSWTREQIIHPDVALNNPRVAIEKMIDIFKQYGYGKNGLGRWTTFSSGIYLKFLKRS